MTSWTRRKWVLERIPKNTKGAEVGVWRGDFSDAILKSCNPSEMYLIDPWIKTNGESKFWGSESSQETLDTNYKFVIDRFKDESSVKITRTSTGLSGFGDNFFDWVYIDGDHSYEGVLKDLTEAFRVVKVGGLIFGDDYTDTGWWKDGVISAVSMYEPFLEKIQEEQYLLVKE